VQRGHGDYNRAVYLAACSPNRILAIAQWVRELVAERDAAQAQCADHQRGENEALGRAEKAEARVERLREALHDVTMALVNWDLSNRTVVEIIRKASATLAEEEPNHD
jgi:hypothetical protein